MASLDDFRRTHFGMRANFIPIFVNAVNRLSQAEPNWREKVKPSEICMYSLSKCILGQVFGMYEVGLARLDMESESYLNLTPFSNFDEYWKIVAGNDCRGFSVAVSAAILDILKPGWHAEIRLASLDMWSHSYCILGQLYGDYFAGLRAVKEVYHNYFFTPAFANWDRLWKELISNRLQMEKEFLYRG